LLESFIQTHTDFNVFYRHKICSLYRCFLRDKWLTIWHKEDEVFNKKYGKISLSAGRVVLMTFLSNNRKLFTSLAAVIFGAIIILGAFLLANWWYQLKTEAEPVKTVGILLAGDMKLDKLVGLKEGLEEQGYLGGVNINYVVENAKDNGKIFNSLASDLIAKKPDVLVALGGVEADALREILTFQQEEIPIVLAGVASTVKRGLVNNLQDHETNITGIDNYHTQLAGKRLELLTKLLPDTRRVMVIYDPEVIPGLQSLDIIENTAALLDIELVKYPVVAKDLIMTELPQALLNHEVDAILLSSSYFLEAAADELFRLSLDFKVPVMAVNKHEAYRGAFAAYGVSLYEQGRQAAPLIAKIFLGQHPSQIPVELSEKIELVVNMDVIKRLGLKVSPVGLSYAKAIYESASLSERGRLSE